MMEAAIEATWILGTQDLVTNARAPETPLVSTISTQTTSKEEVGLRKDGTKECSIGQSPMCMLKHQASKAADN